MIAPRKLLVEGWHSIPHSYAVINGFQCLQLLQEPNLQLWHREVPFHNQRWKRTGGLFPKSQEEMIDAIAPPPPDQTPDAVYRIAYPFDLSPSTAARTVLFGTSEFRCLLSTDLIGSASLKSSNVTIVTLSNWSREGFINAGADPDKVIVIPSGVDPDIFSTPTSAQRAEMRTGLGNAFVFLSVGALTENKGIDHLLKAFAVVAQKFPKVRLVLKGMGELYRSRELLALNMNLLTQSERETVTPRLGYLDQTMTFASLARLYQMADVYISPYRAEGFNMPVLEAISCGMPVICTAGGSTDDFTTDDFALRVNANPEPVSKGPGVTGTQLQVDRDHLIHQMITAIESPHLAAKARSAGPAFVAAGFTWHQVVQKLLKVLFD